MGRREQKGYVSGAAHCPRGGLLRRLRVRPTSQEPGAQKTPQAASGCNQAGVTC
jgi:hypothetical protein